MTSAPREYRLGNVRLPNPLVVASCPATEDCERLLRCADAGAAAAILKSCHTLGTTPKDKGYRRFQGSERGLWGTSTVARELLPPEKACSILYDIRKHTDMVVIPSVAGSSLEYPEWLDTLRLLEPLNPACVQLDLFYLEADLSLPATQERLRTLILTLKQESGLELLPKMNQELRPGAALEALCNSGIAGWSLLDSVRTQLPAVTLVESPDFPDFLFAKGLDSASLFGAWQLPLVCDYLSRLRAGTLLPILAGGGVSNATDVVRLLSMGADAVQVATPILCEGPAWIRRTLNGLERWSMPEHDGKSASASLTPARAEISREQCTSCGSCARQLMCNAVEIGAEGPCIIRDKCEGCGYCLTLCPAGAISLHPVSNQISTHAAF